MSIAVDGEKVFNAKIDKRGYINKRLKEFKNRNVYIVLIPLEDLDDQS